jgi:hypothetical protein
MQHIILVILFIFFFICNQNKENYYQEKVIQRFRPYTFCKDCTHLDKTKCGLCINCGWCIDKSGKGKCVPGNAAGSHFHNDCAIWRHPNRFHRFRPRFSGWKF